MVLRCYPFLIGIYSNSPLSVTRMGCIHYWGEPINTYINLIAFFVKAIDREVGYFFINVPLFLFEWLGLSLGLC